MAMNKTIISWVQRYGSETAYTWNPIHGCSKVSEGCRYCYAERLSLNFGLTAHPWHKQHAEENVTIKPDKLDEPLSLIKKPEPAVVFVCSVSDMFHEIVPDDFRRQMFRTMNHPSLSHVTFIILTKRPEALHYWGKQNVWTDNIWMGTSIEDMRVIERLPELIQNMPGRVTKFLSVEPLIDHLDAGNYFIREYWKHLDWCVVGGESGPKHRPMPHLWAREVRDICIDHSVPFYFKQSSGPRTELGTALHYGNGQFWEWNQYPGDFALPKPTGHHTYADEDVPLESDADFNDTPDF